MTSTHLLNISTAGDFTTSLSRWFQCLTTFSVKKSFLIFNLNLLLHNLRRFPVIISLATWWVEWYQIFACWGREVILLCASVAEVCSSSYLHKRLQGSNVLCIINWILAILLFCIMLLVAYMIALRAHNRTQCVFLRGEKVSFRLLCYWCNIILC